MSLVPFLSAIPVIQWHSQLDFWDKEDDLGEIDFCSLKRTPTKR